ncbi:unnamed protein product [Protopolystoma xenopodis]|uniref:Peptidase C1A papain C-terminal domain-containing protein n=1 Tax=Protopolystoma xenopodis TaxID=117903 RepID=A0A448WRN1_9PLAT|nr:unnamed protein product [Protopolystoma xenopodis]
MIAGKYSEDFGMVEEKCNPYTAKTSGECMTPASCRRYYSTEYYYVGGYYGATNEALMMLELINNGPFPVGFQVYSDFHSYSSGIYHHIGIVDNINRFDPFVPTSHAVLLVGYGVEPTTGEKFWSLKNSWGSHWGEMGFFRIRRSTNECGIESLAVGFSPVL